MARASSLPRIKASGRTERERRVRARRSAKGARAHLRGAFGDRSRFVVRNPGRSILPSARPSRDGCWGWCGVGNGMCIGWQRRHDSTTAGRFRPHFSLIGIGLLLSLCRPTAVQGSTRYQINASIHADAPQIRGHMRASFTNTAHAPLTTLLLLLFPNRFASAANDTELLNDVTRPFVYPRERFQAGGIVLEGLSVADDAGSRVLSGTSWADQPGLPAKCVLRIGLDRPIEPGATLDLDVSFSTTVPERFGAFGHFRHALTVLGGWHPYLPGLTEDGVWLVDRYPPAAMYDVEIAAPDGQELLLNGRHAASGPLQARLSRVHFLSLMAAPRFERADAVAGTRQVTVYSLPPKFTHRVGAGPDPPDLLLEAAAELAEGLSAGDRSDPLVIVEAPLRLVLTHPGEGMVVVSDRAFHVQQLLRPFHRRQLSEAIAYELMGSAVAQREHPEDHHWVAAGLAWATAQEEQQRREAKVRSVYDWIRWFNILAIVDRFESQPKIPFVEAFFEQLTVEDPVHQRILTYNNRLPPGRLVFAKLRTLLGKERFRALVAQYRSHPETFRQQASGVFGSDLARFFADWAQPYPPLDYLVEASELNQPVPGGFHHQASIRRRSPRPVREAVPVAFRSRNGSSAMATWDGRGESGSVEAVTSSRVRRVTIDPQRVLLEKTRANNADPAPVQAVIDSADVTVTSTQFGFAALGVVRHRYDYRRDLAGLGFFSERGLGARAGARYHWGPKVDATGYRHNVFGFFTYMTLDDDFKDKSRPGVRDDGSMAGFGLRYDYTNVFGLDNPTDARKFRLFADWHDDRIAGDFRFVNWGALVTGTHPIRAYDTILALQVMNGFTESISGSRVPNQGRYTLGGDRAIRGIGVEDELGRHTVLVRAEVRRPLYPEVDFNLLNFVTMRRGQLRLFVDTGRVANNRSNLYDPSRFAVGIGVGLAAVYDFFGFFPAIAFIEIAGRVDRFEGVDNGPQILLGTRQSF